VFGIDHAVGAYDIACSAVELLAMLKIVPSEVVVYTSGVV
jgi:hypothetical protein